MSDAPQPARKHGILYLVILLLLLSAGAGVWIIMETLEKGEVRLPSLTKPEPVAVPEETLPERNVTADENRLPERVVRAEPQDALPPPTEESGQPFTLPPGQETVFIAPSVEGEFPDDASRPMGPPSTETVEAFTRPASAEAVHPVVQALARTMAENYWPRGTHPQARTRSLSTFGVKRANWLFGGEFAGLGLGAGDPAATRAAILQRFLGQDAGSLRTWAQAFPDALEQAASARMVGSPPRHLTREEVTDLGAIAARQARALAAAVNVYLDTPSIAASVAAYHTAERNAQRANLAYLDATAELERARDAGLAAAELTPMEESWQAASEIYQQAVNERQEAEAAVIRAMNERPGARPLGDGSLLFTAEWLHRRGPQAAESLRGVADVLRQTADRLELGSR